MSSWVKLQTPAIPSVITQGIPDAAQIAESAVDSILQAVQATIEFLSLLESLSISSPLAILIKATVKELQALINDLIGESVGVYFLPVPFVKVTGKPVRPVTVIAPTPNTVAVKTISTTLDPVIPNIPNFGVITGSGGNLGFYNTVYDSLRDSGDTEKPAFKSNDFISGVAVLVGSATLGGMLNAVAAIQTMLGGTVAQGMDRNVVTVPSHVTVQKVRAKKNTIRLSWDSIVVSTAISAFAAEAVINKILVYAKPVSKGRFPTIAPITGVAQFKVAEASVFSTMIELPEPAVDTNYVIGFQYTIKESNGSSTPIDTVRLCQNVFYKALLQGVSVPPAVPTGIPPDWVQYSKPLDIFPQVAAFLQNTLNWVNSLGANAGASVTGLALIAQVIGQVIKQNKAILDRLLADLDSLFLPVVGAFALPITGQGGNNLLLSSLSTGLFSTPADVNRPPFDTGTELVAGFILMAGATNQTNLSAINTVISILTGPSQDNPLVQVSNSIDRIAATVQGNEPIVLGASANQIAVGKKF